MNEMVAELPMGDRQNLLWMKGRKDRENKQILCRNLHHQRLKSVPGSLRTLKTLDFVNPFHISCINYPISSLQQNYAKKLRLKM